MCNEVNRGSGNYDSNIHTEMMSRMSSYSSHYLHSCHNHYKLTLGTELAKDFWRLKFYLALLIHLMPNSEAKNGKRDSRRSMCMNASTPIQYKNLGIRHKSSNPIRMAINYDRFFYLESYTFFKEMNWSTVSISLDTLERARFDKDICITSREILPSFL